MLGSITPLGERGRGRRWGGTVAAYALGSVSGGATAGAAAGAVGAALGAVVALGPSLPWIAGAAVLAGAAIDAAAAALEPSGRLPGPGRQVNEEWLGRYRGWVTGVGFGFQLGLGVATIVTTAAVYSLLVVAAMSGSPVIGAVIGATFGLARALPILAVGRVRSPDGVLLVDARLRRWQPASARLAPVAQVAAAAVLISAAVGR